MFLDSMLLFYIGLAMQLLCIANDGVHASKRYQLHPHPLPLQVHVVGRNSHVPDSPWF